jgi:hypothetical protein
MTDIIRTIFSRRTEIQPDVLFGQEKAKVPLLRNRAEGNVKKLPTSYQLKPGLD